jgi:hypothetical protein
MLGLQKTQKRRSREVVADEVESQTMLVAVGVTLEMIRLCVGLLPTLP